MKFVSYQERRNSENRLIRRYKVYNFLLFKIKKKVLPVLGENNKIIIGGRELTENDKKFLDKVGKITIEGNNNRIELADINNLKCDIRVMGSNNSINFDSEKLNEKTRSDKIVKIIVTGKNNTVEVADRNNLNCNICIEWNNNKICIGKFVHITRINVFMTDNFDNRELIIGESITCQSAEFAILGNDRKIHVGNDCMFSGGIAFWTTDFHPIYDLETHKRINEEKNIIIGNHVWLGANVMVTKGSVIPSGCVVGTKSFVNKAFTKENCIIAGSPAKVVKENIRWEREMPKK